MPVVTERRFTPRAVRASAPRLNSMDSPGTIVGYASVFNSLSEDLGGFRERVAPGAFSRSIRERADVHALVNHDPNLVIGRTTNGTLRLVEDSVGLSMACDLPNTSYARDLWESVKRGDMSQMSFAFTAEDEDWGEEDDPDTGDRCSVRTLKAVRLLDCSAVTYPAYSSTSVGVDTSSLSIGKPSFNSLFPEGAPAEVRSRVGDIRTNLALVQDRRRRLVNFVLGI